jgi:ABC-2 type transport system permease protein
VSGRIGQAISNMLAVAYRQTLVLRHDRGFLLSVGFQPVVLLLLYGLGISFKPANVSWAVLDRTQSTASRRLIEDVQTTDYFQPPRHVASYAEARTLLRRGAVTAVLVIPQDFARDLERGRPQVQLLLDGTDPITAARVGGIVSQVATTFDTGREPPRREGKVPIARVEGPIDVRQRFWFNPTLLDRTFFLAGLLGMLLTNLCLSSSSLGIVGERESGTFEQTLSLPITTLEIVLGKLIPLVVVGYVLLIFTTLACGLAFGLWPQGSWIGLLVVTLPFMLASLAIGVLVSALARTSAQAVFITVFFILPSFVLSGVMLPFELMPPPVRILGVVLPLRWYQIALRRLVTRGAGFTDIIVPGLALLAIFIGLLAVIRWRLKPRLA